MEKKKVDLVIYGNVTCKETCKGNLIGGINIFAKEEDASQFDLENAIIIKGNVDAQLIDVRNKFVVVIGLDCRLDNNICVGTVVLTV